MRVPPRAALLALIAALALLAAACNRAGDKPEAIASQNQAARTAAASASTPTPQEGRFGGGPVDVSIFDLLPGDCIGDPMLAYPTPDDLERVGELDRITIVSCDDPSAVGRVSRLVLVEDPANTDTPYPGEAALDEIALRECSLNGPFSYFIPVQPGWEAGDRTIQCIDDFTVRYTVDSCLNESDNVVPCDDPDSRVRVTRIVDLSGEWADDADYPGDDYFERTFHRRCHGNDTYFLYPSDLTWELNDRELVCARALPPRS